MTSILTVVADVNKYIYNKKIHYGHLEALYRNIVLLAQWIHSVLSYILILELPITLNLFYNLCTCRMGDRTDVDTTSFRRGIWNYIHCMFGIRHDDYDYSEVNQLLERALKAYVKTVTCYPERITRKDYDSFMREFKHSEKVG